MLTHNYVQDDEAMQRGITIIAEKSLTQNNRFLVHMDIKNAAIKSGVFIELKAKLYVCATRQG